MSRELQEEEIVVSIRTIYKLVLLLICSVIFIFPVIAQDILEVPKDDPLKKEIENITPPIVEDPALKNESARSDKFTGGKIERTTLQEGMANIKITVDVPAFKLTLWQDDKEVISYHIGVGMKKFPIAIGEKKTTQVIWNPSWIPPNSDWVKEMSGIEPGKPILPTDPRNPIGKVKIPLGGGYLIHQARSTKDLGNLVSHGCVRMLKTDLLDLADRIVAAYGYPVSKQRIERAKKTQKTLVAVLNPELPVDINYDTQVVEGGVLRLYPDVYDRKTLTVKNLRKELEWNEIDDSEVDDQTLRQMIKRVGRYQVYTVSLDSIKKGRALADGKLQPLIWRPAPTQRKGIKRKANPTSARLTN
jgi:lipoprotein-anchoring transpeptidase ErfK/SrfK